MSWNINENLAEIWELEEASGNRVGALGNYNLVPTNAINGRNAGRLGSGPYGYEVRSVYATWLDLSPAAMTGQTEWSFTFWINPVSMGGSGYPRLFEFGASTSNRISFGWRNSTQNNSLFSHYQSPSGGSSSPSPTGIGASNPYNTDWHFYTINFIRGYIQFWYGNSTTKTLTPFLHYYQPFSPEQITYTYCRFLGGSFFNSSDTGEVWAGTCDQIGYWRRSLTYADIRWLFNKGAGRSASAIIAGRGGAFASPKPLAVAREMKIPSGVGDVVPSEGQLFPLKL